MLVSWFPDLAEQRRADKAASAEQARLNADAASQRRIREQAAQAEQRRTDQQARATRRRERFARLRAWAGAHRVGLLIYPLALASACMAIPAMAAYGIQVYGNATGLVLPVLSELGMWAFALAVEHTRTSDPDRPVWALRAGVGVFAAVGFGLNLAHGLDTGVSAGVVMGTASIAGVAAHQLVTAGPRRTRTERQEARLQARTDRKLAKIRRAAVGQAGAKLDEHGGAQLVFTPGRYVLTRGTHGRLVTAIDTGTETSGIPVDAAGIPVIGVEVLAETGIGEQVEQWLANQPGHTGSGPVAALDDGESQPATEPDESPLDRGGDLHQSHPNPPDPEPEPEPETTPESDGAIPSPSRRSMDELRAEFARLLAQDPPPVDPTSARDIRRVLQCGAARARVLRDEYNGGHQ